MGRIKLFGILFLFIFVLAATVPFAVYSGGGSVAMASTDPKDESTAIAKAFGGDVPATEFASEDSSSELCYPRIRTVDGWSAEVCAINTCDQVDLDGEFIAYGEDGSVVGIPVGVYLAAHERRQIEVDEGFDNHESIRYIVFRANRSCVAGYLENRDRTGQRDKLSQELLVDIRHRRNPANRPRFQRVTLFQHRGAVRWQDPSGPLIGQDSERCRDGGPGIFRRRF